MQKLYQAGTMQLLAEGLLDRNLTVGELLQKGNFGIGTGEGIDGELIVLEGQAYKISERGTAEQLSATFPVAFANYHQAAFTFFKKYTHTDLTTIESELKTAIKGRNRFFAVLIKGEFESLHTRSSGPSAKPYPDLATIAKNQVEFRAEKVTGCAIGYYAPAIFQGVTVAGYHHHFLADDLHFGGHILSAAIEECEVYVQIFDAFEQKMPQSAEYLDKNLDDVEKLAEIIESAES